MGSGNDTAVFYLSIFDGVNLVSENEELRVISEPQSNSVDCASNFLKKRDKNRAWIYFDMTVTSSSEPQSVRISN